MDTANWTFSQSFTPQFQAMRSDLESQISTAKSTASPPPEIIQGLSVSLAKATKALADATGSIPSYDQKQYEIQLKSLEKSITELRASAVPKSKFAFKRKPQAPTTAPTTPSTPSTKSPEPPTPIPPSSTTTNLILSSHTNKYLTRSNLPDHPQQTDLSISDLSNCIVNLLPPSSSSSRSTPTDDAPPEHEREHSHLIISALHARNLTNCVILLPSIQGSALLHDLTQCIIVLGCHQFRMHSSKQTDVFLSISSNPIIEDCNTIRFAQYPSPFRTALLDDQKESPPFTVQDFSHIRPTPSPHFSMMDDADRNAIEHWLGRARYDSTYTTELPKLLPQ